MRDEGGVGGIVSLLAERQSVLICGHVRPDPDCIGSQLALYHALRKMGRDAEMVLADRVPDNCLFLPGSGEIRQRVAEPRPHGAAFVLDTPRPERLGSCAEDVARIPVVVNIDHHPSNILWGTHNWVDPSASATAEFIYLLIRELGLAVDAPIATCLYAGILTDTGRFCYSNTTPRAHQIAAELLRCGAAPQVVAEQIYGSDRIQKMRLLARVLGGLRIDERGVIAWVRITRGMYEESGASPQDTEGLVNYARDIAGVRVALLLEEMPDGKSVRVSMRSRDPRVDVNAIAQSYGGGGHRAAAGALIPGELEHVERQLVGRVRDEIGRLPGGA